MDEYIGNIEAEDVEDHPHEQISSEYLMDGVVYATSARESTQYLVDFS